MLLYIGIYAEKDYLLQKHLQKKEDRGFLHLTAGSRRNASSVLPVMTEGEARFQVRSGTKVQLATLHLH